jgi:hypothetical protein
MEMVVQVHAQLNRVLFAVVGPCCDLMFAKRSAVMDQTTTNFNVTLH